MTRPAARSLTHKVLTCLLVAVCVVAGVAGLVLPIIPGLVFLALAFVIAARAFPSLRARFRGHHWLGRHLHGADRFSRLSTADQIRVAGLYCLKLPLDGLAAVAARLRAR